MTEWLAERLEELVRLAERLARDAHPARACRLDYLSLIPVADLWRSVAGESRRLPERDRSIPPHRPRDASFFASPRVLRLNRVPRRCPIRNDC